MDVRFVVFVLSVTATATCSYRDNLCGDVSGYFTYTISNRIQRPFFRASMKLKICRVNRAPFIRYMEDSVMKNPTQFKRFSTTFSSPYGYFIDSINNVTGNWNVDKTYWQISNSSGPLDVGVSTYIPSPGDKILFKFVKGSCQSHSEKLLFGETDGQC